MDAKSLHPIEEIMTLDEEFEAAQRNVRTLSKTPSNDALLKLYGLFKQGSVGNVQGSRPGMLDLKGRAKFDAWSSYKGMSSDDAKRAYTAFVSELLKTK